jgi:hypothetical protein
MQPSSRALKPIRNLYHDANMRSSYCLRIAGILRRKLTACWPTIPNACSLTVCAPHSSYALMRSLRDHHLLRPPSKRRARTCTIPRAVTQPLRRAIRKSSSGDGHFRTRAAAYQSTDPLAISAHEAHHARCRASRRACRSPHFAMAASRRALIPIFPMPSCAQPVAIGPPGSCLRTPSAPGSS